MSATKKPKKLRLDDKTENVSHPWQAWWHPDKKRKFYKNLETKESIWDHPDTLKRKETPSASCRQTRKRKDDEKKPQASIEDDRMEVDVAPPPKRKAVETEETDEITSKRPRRHSSVEVIEKRDSNREQASSSSTKPQANSILPRVPWAHKTRPITKIPYRACAIFDTCALLENPSVLNDSVEKQILTIIPYAVLSELDGLKNSESIRREANIVSNRIRDFQEEKNHYLRVETSVEQQIRIDEFRPNESVKDDAILKTALRIKKEILSIASALKLNDRAVLLVTNDSVLSNKALTHDLTVENVNDFMDIINGRVKQHKPSDRRSNSRKTPPRSIRYDEPQRTSRSSERQRPSAAVERVKKQREVTDWIQGMSKKAIDQNIRSENRNEKAPNKPRPSIPLADEIVPSTPKPIKTARSYNHHTYQPSKPVKSIELDRSRPQMPLSLSDDEAVTGDDMDCT
ncbi:hypothetical protein GCK72_006133 [Caenorhabditis remanei]|uniref:WW domain-containing protein n=1 Tax=Caenorhabditis remanei TaxID=31234 RepID=A0A6A5HHH8_CAERE|nr:hypothetical protein GCK72_006133 [Caenorhabditis remanei]KAF1766177.1 hypothetical protein GCK72_006133 [Caenorhabditis remanei]